MTMTIPVQTQEINVVRINSFVIDPLNENIFIQFQYGYRNNGIVSPLNMEAINLGDVKYNQLMNLTPPGNKTFKQWIRPLIYTQIANHLGITVGDIE